MITRAQVRMRDDDDENTNKVEDVFKRYLMKHRLLS